jgi:hypothetical protein
VETLVDGRVFIDPSIAFFEDRWWLFVAESDNTTPRLYFADELIGPWQEHPESPIVTNDANIARPGGRTLVYDGRLFRYAQDGDPTYGNQIWAFEITELSTTAYHEELAREYPILKASGKGWNAQAMHTLDPVLTEGGRWIAAVDGFGKYLVFGLKY